MPKIRAKRKPNNPRQITRTRLDRLGVDLDEYGDLSGVIHNTRTGNLVDGNQRSIVFNLEECDIEIVREFQEPDAQGTTALGFIVWRGHNYTYRRVDWPQEKEDAACIKANFNAGSWDGDKFANEWDTAQVLEWAGMDDAAWKKDKSEAAMWGEMLESVKEETQSADAEPQIDRAEELRVKWGVERGQLWGVGEHRIYCADSVDVDIKSELVVTDPPYDLSADVIVKIVYGISNRAIILCSDRLAFDIGSLADVRLDFIWKHRKPRSFPTNNMPVMYHNHCLIIAKRNIKTGWHRPTSDFGSVIELSGKEFEDTEMGHGKASALFVEMIRGFGDPQICDPFMGTGATLLACNNLRRVFTGIEKEPSTFAVALERFTSCGLTPHLINDAV